MTILNRNPPVETRVFLQDVHIYVLLDETVEQNGQRGEADVVERQVSRVIQRLGFGKESRVSIFVLVVFMVFRFCECTPVVRSHKRTGRGTGGK